MRLKVNTPALSEVVPEVKLLAVFLITTDTPFKGMLALVCTNPFTTLVFSWACSAMSVRNDRAKQGPDLSRLNLIWQFCFVGIFTRCPARLTAGGTAGGGCSRRRREHPPPQLFTDEER